MMLQVPGIKMMKLPVLLLLSLCVPGQAQTDTSPEQSRPYAVLLKQNLVLLGSTLGLLLIAMIVLAVCVYKPIRRR
ncbi:uncharacterized protein C12orf76 homolog [Ascaphus truei]|uniref:uncharacterized protein C12orf76 homolog n=1 Tax=Ascaphus truei TaxID=8439 RepID=UPI003F59DDBF